MRLSNSPADGIVRPARGLSRPVRLLALVLLVAAAMAALGARAALADTPTVQLSFDNSSIPADGSVTMSATVTSTVGIPTGSVSFFNAASPDTAIASGALDMNVTSDSATAQVLVSGLPSGAYSIDAFYTPDFPAAFGLGLSKARSVTLALTVGGTTPTTHDTQVTLTTPSLVVDSTTPVTLTATVAEIGGTGTPAGTVAFTDTISGSAIPLGPGAVTLDNGVAQLTVFDFSPGPHQIVASYSGAGSNNPSSSQPLLLTSNPPVDTRVQTTTSVTVSPATIAAGDTATITATIVQIGASNLTAPPGGAVTFDSYSVWGQGVYLGTAALGTAPAGMTSAPNQAIIEVAAWQAADYTITASYFGDIFDQSSGGQLPFSVLPARAQATIAYSGDTTAEFGHSATFAATVTDQDGSPLAGRTATFTLGSQSCTRTSDANGYASCSFVVTEHPGSPAASVSVPQDLRTQAATLNLHFTVIPEPTAITAGFQAGPVTTALTATLLTDTGAPVPNAAVTLTLGSETCHATTNGAGLATCDVSTIVGQPTATLSASYGGDTDNDQSATSNVVQLVLATALSYTGATTSAYHGAPILSAVLTNATGAPVAGRAVTFTLGSQSCAGTADATGTASCSIASVVQDPGSYTLSIAYPGDAATLASNTSYPFTVTPAPTTLTASIPTPGASSTMLTATLEETASGALLAGKAVTLTLGAASCSASTNASGVASCSVTTPGGSSAMLNAAFAGDLDYASSSDTKTVALLTSTTAIYTGSTTGEYHDDVTLSGTLFDSHGTTPSGQTLTFTLGSQSCSAATRKSGKASCKITLTQPSGSYSVGVNYAGNSTYAPSTASRPFTIAREETTLFSHIANALLNNDTISLSSTLLEDSVTPIANRTVTMTLGHASCTGVTNTQGVATCVVQRVATLGPSTFTATFAGDAYYLPASLNQSTLLCAFPSGGSFVIGDRDSGSVTFWGAQWWKQNSLSHGDAPSSFKGWAQGSFDQNSNDGWSTDPGNSASPPSGQLPTYMAVIETSSTTKIGSRIFGDGVHIVVVKTDPGYSPNSGHAGTGTIVAGIS